MTKRPNSSDETPRKKDEAKSKARDLAGKSPENPVDTEYQNSGSPSQPAKEPAQESTKEGQTRREFLVNAAAVGVTVGLTSEFGGQTNQAAMAQTGQPAATGAMKAAVPAKSITVELNVNGETRALNIDPRASLLDTLREHLDLTGPKKGCDHGQCGACTVLVDGKRINSCLTFAVMYQGKEIVTIEGLGQEDNLHPMQEAFIKHDGFQCGYCTPGQICSAVAMLSEHKSGAISCLSESVGDCSSKPELTESEIKERMSGNLCRCGAYTGIVEAIKEVAKRPS